MALFVYYQNSNTSRPEGKKVSSLQAKVWCWQLCCDLGWHWMGRRFIQSSTTSQEGSYPGLATVVMHMGRLNWFRLMQRSLVPLEPLTWARTHGKRGLHARFKSLRFEDDAQSHRKVTDLLVTSHKTSKVIMKNWCSASLSNWSLYYWTHHSTSLYNSLCNFSSFSTTYRYIQDYHSARKGEVWQCSPGMSMQWRWIKAFPTFCHCFIWGHWARQKCFCSYQGWLSRIHLIHVLTWFDSCLAVVEGRMRVPCAITITFAWVAK